MRFQRHAGFGIVKGSWLNGTLVQYPGEYGQGQDYFVDHTNGNDGNNGLSWERPFLTIQAGVDAVTKSGDRILIAPGDYVESVVTPDSVTGPNYVALIGCTPGGVKGSPNWWSADNAAENCLTVNTIGWYIAGINFRGPSAASCISLDHHVTTDDNQSWDTLIENCLFFGQVDGLYGINLNGAPHQVTIQDCEFEFFTNVGASGTAIYSQNSGFACPFRTKILRNIFNECDNYIVARLNSSVVADNHFMIGAAITPVMVIDCRNANHGDNQIVGNYFGPVDFSNIGGYWDSAVGVSNWAGNYSFDILEATVGLNGITYLPPA